MNALWRDSIALALALAFVRGARAQDVLGPRTLATDSTISPPYLTYQTPALVVRFDTSRAFGLMQSALEDTKATPGWRQRFRSQLDSARAALQRGASAWVLTNGYVVGHLLERIPFDATDRRTQQRVDHLDVETYVERCGRLCGRGERHFQLPDGLLAFSLLLWES